MKEGVRGLVQSSHPGDAVQSRDPKGDGGVKRVYKCWGLVYKHAETQVRSGVGKEPGRVGVGAWAGVGEGRGRCR